MSLQTHWMLIPPFQHPSYVPILAELVTLRHHSILLQYQFSSEHIPHSIALSVDCLRSGFLVVSWPHDSFWFSICTIPPGLRHFQPPNAFYRHLLDDVIGWIALSNCCSCLMEVAKSSFWSINHCSLRWICCWTRCWTLQNIHTMESSCVSYVKVGKFPHLEQRKISHLSVNETEIITLNVQHNLILSVNFIYYPWD